MNKKAVWIAAGGTAAVVIAGIVLLFALGGGASRHTGGEGTPYPYEWVEKRDGSVAIIPGGTPPEGYVWNARADDDTAARVTPTERGFNVVPLTDDRTSVTCTLSAADWEDDRLCSLELLLDSARSGRKLKAKVLSDNLTLLPGGMRGGEELGCPYRVWQEDDGSVGVFLTETAAEPDWRVILRSGYIAHADRFAAADGGIGLWLHADDAGETGALIYSASRGLQLTVGLSSDGAGVLSAVSHELAKLDAALADDEAYLGFVLAVGSVELPDGFTPQSWSVRQYGRYVMGTVELSREGDGGAERFRYSLLPNADADVISETFPRERVTEVFTGDGVIWIYPDADASAAWWEDETRVCLLECIGVADEAPVLEAVERFRENA